MGLLLDDRRRATRAAIVQSDGWARQTAMDERCFLRDPPACDEVGSRIPNPDELSNKTSLN